MPSTLTQREYTLTYFFLPGDNYVFQNGCRAQPKRQLHGDICYLDVKPHDGQVFYVTANTSGYYCNKVINYRYITVGPPSAMKKIAL